MSGSMNHRARTPSLFLFASVLAGPPACGDDVDPLDSASSGSASPSASASASGGSSASASGGSASASGGTDGGSTGDATGGSGSTGVAGQLSHAADIQPIWDKYCMAACHEAGGSGAGSLLMDGDDYDALVGVAALGLPTMDLVAPGDRLTSYVWHKLSGTQMEVGGAGSKMPLGMAMTQEELDTIGQWIDEGAQP